MKRRDLRKKCISRTQDIARLRAGGDYPQCEICRPVRVAGEVHEIFLKSLGSPDVLTDPDCLVVLCDEHHRGDDSAHQRPQGFFDTLIPVLHGVRREKVVAYRDSARPAPDRYFDYETRLAKLRKQKKEEARNARMDP